MYTITLQDAPADITELARAHAEHLFRRTLERALGGPEQVLAAYKAWTTAEDTAEDEMAPEDVALAKRWIAASGRARGGSFRAVGVTEAWSEVRGER